MVIDWRKPLLEGPGPDEPESQPHDYQAMSLLGVVLKHRPHGSSKIERKYIPILSKNRDHNSYAVGCHLDHLWDQILEASENDPSLRMFFLAKTRFEVRFDNASHFVSREFLHYVCKELPQHELFAHFKTFSWYKSHYKYELKT